MSTQSSNRGALIGGSLLIGFGVLALVSQLFRDVFNMSVIWPFFIIGVGAVFFIVMFAGGKSAAPFAIPGSIIAGIGLMLLFQSITDHWESWSYGWTVIIFFVGVGIFISGLWGGNAHQRQSGLGVMRTGFILFVIFGAIFEGLFSGFSGYLFPVLLIGVGVYLVLSRSGLLGRRAGADEISSTATSENKLEE
jgi:hypothetical protein